MDPLLAPLITGGASLLGSIFSSQTTAQNTQEQMQNNLMMQQNSEQFNAQQAQQQRDYETQMSNTAYQRSSADMKAAGLNPMMMFSSGGAASTPGGATASVGTGSASTPQRTSPFAGLGQAAATAMDTAVKQKQIDLLTSEAAKNKVDADYTGGVLSRLTGYQGTKTAAEADALQPDAIQGAAIGGYLRAHPMIAQALSVGPYLSERGAAFVRPWTGAVGDVVGGVGKGIGGALSSGAKNLLQFPDQPTKLFSEGSSARSTFGLPSIRQSFKDAGGTDELWDQFSKDLASRYPK